MVRRRTWLPPARSAHLSAPSPSLAQLLPYDASKAEIWKAAARTWSQDPNAHLAFYRPPCSLCPLPAANWARCRRKPCRKIIARCREHDPTDPMTAARAAHEASHG